MRAHCLLTARLRESPVLPGGTCSLGRQLRRLQSRQGTDLRRYVDGIRSSSCVLAVLSLHSLPSAHLLDIMFLLICPVKSSLSIHFLSMLSTHKPCLVSLSFPSSPSYRIPTSIPCSRDLFPQRPAPCLTHATMLIVLCVAKAVGREGGIVKVRQGVVVRCERGDSGGERPSTYNHSYVSYTVNKLDPMITS